MKTLEADIKHKKFVRWAEHRGVKINSVQPAAIPGRGLGIIAKRRIEAGEKLVSVPPEALLTVQSIPEDFQESHRGSTVHGLLASFLAFGGPETAQLDPWKAIWPSLQDFARSMPLLWPRIFSEPFSKEKGTKTNSNAVQTFFPLPPAIGGRWASNQVRASSISKSSTSKDIGLLRHQEKRLMNDWESVSKSNAESTFTDYVYHWLVVNTRCCYYEVAGADKFSSIDDRIVLCPFIDCFNHRDSGCDVHIDNMGFTVTSDRVYDANEEIYTSYGGHSNDFLLVECGIIDGFTLEKNRWDSLPLDDLLDQALLDERDRKRLADTGYLGHYTLSVEGVCHRTQVAVRTQTLDTSRWESFVAGHIFENEQDDSKTDWLIAMRILQVYFEEAEGAIVGLQKVEHILPPVQRQTLLKRWGEIKVLIQQAFTNGIKKNIQEETHELFKLPSPLKAD